MYEAVPSILATLEQLASTTLTSNDLLLTNARIALQSLKSSLAHSISLRKGPILTMFTYSIFLYSLLLFSLPLLHFLLSLTVLPLEPDVNIFAPTIRALKALGTCSGSDTPLSPSLRASILSVGGIIAAMFSKNFADISTSRNEVKIAMPLTDNTLVVLEEYSLLIFLLRLPPYSPFLDAFSSTSPA